jgi:hypothetical protein
MYSDNYKLRLQIIDYSTDLHVISYINYKYFGTAKIGTGSIQHLVDNMLDGTSIELVIDGLPENNPEELHPVIMKMAQLKLSLEYGQVAPTIYAQIIMVDNIPLSPRDQKGDVYDNVLGQGFEIYDYYTVPVKPSNVGTVDIEGIVYG